MRSPALVVSLVLAASLGCAGNYYDSWKAKNPDGMITTPSAGISLHEVLASVYAPPVADYSRFVGKIDVLRFPGGQAVVLTEQEIDAVIAEDAKGDYAVIALVRCLSEVDMQRYGGEKVAWYVVDDGGLAAWNHYDFSDNCMVSPDFRPASGKDATLVTYERATTAYADANYPAGMGHVGEYYMKGIVYAGAGRLDDAKAMLAAGDGTVDVAQRGERHEDLEGSRAKPRTIRSADIDAIRERLVKLLEGKEQASAAPVPATK
jgi:hypothetical protein